MTSVTLVSTPNDGTCGIGTYTGTLASALEDESEVNHITVPLRSKNPLPYITGAIKAGLTSDDVVHVQHEYGIFGPKSVWSWLFFPLLYLTTTLRSTSVVVTLHSAWTEETVTSPFQSLKRVYVKANNRLLTAGANYFILLSENCRERFEESTSIRHYEVLSHGVQTETIEMTTAEVKREFGYEPNDTVIVTPGYVRPEKGQDVFIEVADAVPEHEFLIAGGTQAEEDESYFRTIMQSSPDNVQITGVLDDCRFHAAFNVADLIVLPYYEVTQSGVFNWCVAYDVPTVGSDEPYFGRLQDEWNAVAVFDVEDIDQGVHLVRSLLENRTRREEIESGMKEYEKASSMEAVIEKHVHIYERLKTLHQGQRGQWRPHRQ